MSPYVLSAQILPSTYSVRSTSETPHCAVFSILRSLLSWAHSRQRPVFKHSWDSCVDFRCFAVQVSCLLRYCILSLVPDASGQRGGPIIKGWMILNWTFDSWRWYHHAVPKRGAPVTQWRGAISQKNGDRHIFHFLSLRPVLFDTNTEQQLQIHFCVCYKLSLLHRHEYKFTSSLINYSFVYVKVV
jgi:hypothetical protein